MQLCSLPRPAPPGLSEGIKDHFKFCFPSGLLHYRVPLLSWPRQKCSRSSFSRVFPLGVMRDCREHRVKLCSLLLPVISNVINSDDFCYAEKSLMIKNVKRKNISLFVLACKDHIKKNKAVNLKSLRTKSVFSYRVNFRGRKVQYHTYLAILRSLGGLTQARAQVNLEPHSLRATLPLGINI